MDSWRPGNSKRIGRQRSFGRRLPQLSDVENEVNGVLTYDLNDRAKSKPGGSPQIMRALAGTLSLKQNGKSGRLVLW